MSLRRINSTANNATDFVLSTPAPCANTGAGQCDTDVGVTQSGLIGPVPVGNRLAYVLTVTNNGSAPAAEVTLDDTLPIGSEFVFAAPETCVFQPPGAVSCALGDLQAGQSRTVVLVLSPTLAVTLTNTVIVSSLGPDSNPANNTATQETAASCVGAGSHTLSGRIKAEKKGLARVTVTLKGAGLPGRRDHRPARELCLSGRCGRELHGRAAEGAVLRLQAAPPRRTDPGRRRTGALQGTLPVEPPGAQRPPFPAPNAQRPHDPRALAGLGRDALGERRERLERPGPPAARSDTAARWCRVRRPGITLRAAAV